MIGGGGERGGAGQQGAQISKRADERLPVYIQVSLLYHEGTGNAL